MSTNLIDTKSKIKLKSSIFIFYLLFIIIILNSCSGLFIRRYDYTTYKNLTDSKPEVAALYMTFINDSLNLKQMAAVRLKIAQMCEYEKGKGVKYIETIKQIEIIKNMFERHVKDRLEKGRWSETRLNSIKQNIEEAFDIAIQTEGLRIK